jgi:hypothetical protein
MLVDPPGYTLVLRYIGRGNAGPLVWLTKMPVDLIGGLIKLGNTIKGNNLPEFMH